ncbi:MAG: polysaccharide deacetylase family protein [Leptolyngbya sp. RL_3_1]|nr:polysaccharide deacetylase family protein [Leptolyngbya sp. RL_3_1]
MAPLTLTAHSLTVRLPSETTEPETAQVEITFALDAASQQCVAPHAGEGKQALPWQQALLSLGPKAIAHAGAEDWPDIHEQARLAQVPVIMYHDVLPEKQVFFDVTVAELEADLRLIRAKGLTPISLDQLAVHLRTGLPLPARPVLLTFDDGYQGHYDIVYPLLRAYGYPAVFSIFSDKVDGEIVGRSTVTWEHLEEMAADPLVTIAAHSITHPRDLRTLSDSELRREVRGSKQRLEERLGIEIRHFTYPEGKHDARVTEAVEDAGYETALAMDDNNEGFAGESENVLAIARFGQSRLEDVIGQAWGGPPLPQASSHFDFASNIQLIQPVVNDTPLSLVFGGKPISIHADSRYQVPEIIEGTDAIAAVDGGFFSMKYLDSNVMIGPVLSQHTREFVPGNASENPRLNGRPLALIGPDRVEFVPFDANRHNTLAGIQVHMPEVTDAFVGAAWLVREGQAQSAQSFGTLFDFEAERHRAFWGINHAGQPVVGVTNARIDSVELGETLAELGLRDAIMVDSGASTSLAYRGESLVKYEPRPVPHVVALVPSASASCPQIAQGLPLE